MLKQILLTTLSILITSFAFGDTTTVILTRHAEKVDEMTDRLSGAGVFRAQTLSQISQSFAISAVYASTARRTIDTATPTAARNNLPVQTSIHPMNYRGLLSDIMTHHKGKAVLVVGHSNTVPEFINEVTGRTNLQWIEEHDFSNLFVVQISKDREIRVRHYRYEAMPTGELNIALLHNQIN